MMTTIQLTAKHIKEAVSPIVILPHTAPDGDTIGSTVALYLGLRAIGKDVYLVNDDALPADFGHIAEGIAITSEHYHQLGICHQTAICVDMSDTERLRGRQHLLANCQVYNIDHHRTNSRFGDVVCVDDKAAATAEIIYHLLMELQIPLSGAMAEALYVAIITDTGDFRYSSTTAQTLSIAAALLAVNFDRERTINLLYHNVPREKLALHANAIGQTRYFREQQLALCTVSLFDLSQFSAKDEYSDGLVEQIRDIAGVQMVIMLKEKSAAEVKVSLRSIGDIDVSTIAFDHHGGGHRNAAGFSLHMSLEQAIDYCVNELIPGVVL